MTLFEFWLNASLFLGLMTAIALFAIGVTLHGSSHRGRYRRGKH